MSFTVDGFTIDELGPLYTNENTSFGAENSRVEQAAIILQKGHELVDRVYSFILYANEQELDKIRKAKNNE